jgi:hypothetical protein
MGVGLVVIIAGLSVSSGDTTGAVGSVVGIAGLGLDGGGVENDVVGRNVPEGRGG